MANLLLFTAITIFPLFTAVQAVSVRIQYCEEPIIEIDFLFFSLTLFPKRKKKKKRRKKSLSKRIKTTLSFKRTLDYFLSNSEILINEINIKPTASAPSTAVLQTQNITSLIQIIIAYAASKAKRIDSADRIFTLSKDNTKYNEKSYYDVTLNSTIQNVIFSFFYLVFKSNRQSVR